MEICIYQANYGLLLQKILEITYKPHHSVECKTTSDTA